VLRRLSGALRYEAEFVPEAAELVILGGKRFPQPDWQEAQWRELQTLILDEQLRWDKAATQNAEREGKRFIIFDRAPYDNLAYPTGAEVTHARLGPGELWGFKRYDLVIHLESLATARPEAFGAYDSAARYETLEQAQHLELMSRECWRKHPNWHFVGGGDLHKKYMAVLNLITALDLKEVA
jgi:hypothetical protein